MAKEEKEFITSAPFLLLFLKLVLLQALCCVYFHSHWTVNLVYILIISRKWQNGAHFSLLVPVVFCDLRRSFIKLLQVAEKILIVGFWQLQAFSLVGSSNSSLDFVSLSFTAFEGKVVSFKGSWRIFAPDKAGFKTKTRVGSACLWGLLELRLLFYGLFRSPLNFCQSLFIFIFSVNTISLKFLFFFFWTFNKLQVSVNCKKTYLNMDPLS